MGIDHESIALQFMRNIENREYAECYKLVTDEYKKELSLTDFKFRMEWLHNLSQGEKFRHYETTSIGTTGAVEIRKLSGENVTTDIMPEFDFTVESEYSKPNKSRKVWLRFKNENSDKIAVINYSYHYNFRQGGISNVTKNHFFTSNYVVIMIDKANYLVDVRGGLRNERSVLMGQKTKETLAKMSYDETLQLLKNEITKDFKVVVLVSKGDFSKAKPLLDYAKSSKLKFQTFFTSNIPETSNNYRLRNPFPVKK